MALISGFLRRWCLTQRRYQPPPGIQLHKQIKMITGFLGNCPNWTNMKKLQMKFGWSKGREAGTESGEKRGHDVNKIISCYSQSLWSIVTVNTGLVNIGGNTGLGSREVRVTTFSSTDEPWFICAFCLKVPYLIYSRFINIEPTSNSSCLNEAWLTHVVSP